MPAVIGSADPLMAGVTALKALVPALKVVTIEGAAHAGPRGATARPDSRRRPENRSPRIG
jgi:hypothetical protein